MAVPFSAVDLLQALSAGLLVGSAYALMCIGLGIIFGSMNVINFAQGDFLMLGMYAAFYLVAGYGVLASGGRDCTVRLSDAGTGAEHVALSPSGYRHHSVRD